MGKGAVFAWLGAIWAAGVVGTTSGLARANDTSVGGTGVDLYSVKETSVRMKSEDILITHADGQWRVVALYVFENPAADAVKLQIGFPEIGCPDEEEGECHAKPFKGLSTKVDGRSVEHRKGSLKATERWANYLGTFWLFDVTFPGKKQVTIEHTYVMDATFDSMGTNYVSYVTRTGSTWASPIEKATFRIRVPPHATYLTSNETFGAPRDPKFVRDGNAAHTEVRFEKTNWIPEGDLSFGFATAFSSYPVTRLERDALAERAKTLGLDVADLCPRTFPYGSETLESAEQAQSCRNLIYASWGYPFKQKVYRDLYYAEGRSWHKPADRGPLELARDPEALPDFRMEWTSTSERRLLQEIRFDGEPQPKVPEAEPAPKVAHGSPPEPKAEAATKPAARNATGPSTGAEKAKMTRPKSGSGCALTPTPAPLPFAWMWATIVVLVVLVVLVARTRRRRVHP